MPRLQVDVTDTTIAALEHAIAQLRRAGAPDNTPIRIRVRTRSNFHQDGGHVRTVTARWDDHAAE